MLVEEFVELGHPPKLAGQPDVTEAPHSLKLHTIQPYLGDFFFKRLIEQPRLLGVAAEATRQFARSQATSRVQLAQLRDRPLYHFLANANGLDQPPILSCFSVFADYAVSQVHAIKKPLPLTEPQDPGLALHRVFGATPGILRRGERRRRLKIAGKRGLLRKLG
jgi:hypothetical protein